MWLHNVHTTHTNTYPMPPNNRVVKATQYLASREVSLMKMKKTNTKTDYRRLCNQVSERHSNRCFWCFCCCNKMFILYGCKTRQRRQRRQTLKNQFESREQINQNCIYSENKEKMFSFWFLLLFTNWFAIARNFWVATAGNRILLFSLLFVDEWHLVWQK